MSAFLKIVPRLKTFLSFVSLGEFSLFCAVIKSISVAMVKFLIGYGNQIG